MKKDVLKVEFKEIWCNKYVWRIAYQNEDILLRNNFEDVKLKVCSYLAPEYDNEKGILYIKGLFKERDDTLNICTVEEKEEIEKKVKLINQKYGIEKRWRAEKGDTYYSIDLVRFETPEVLEFNTPNDDKRYNNYNYFKTEKQAKEGLKILKQVLVEYKETLEKAEVIINSITEYSED